MQTKFAYLIVNNQVSVCVCACVLVCKQISRFGFLRSRRVTIAKCLVGYGAACVYSWSCYALHAKLMGEQNCLTVKIIKTVYKLFPVGDKADGPSELVASVNMQIGKSFRGWELCKLRNLIKVCTQLYN